MKYLFVILFIAGLEISASLKKTIQLNKEDFNLVTFKKDTINALNNNYKNSIIIFANSYSCNSCFRTFNDYLSLGNYDSSKTDIIVVGRVGLELQSRRTLLNQFEELMPITTNIFFDKQLTNDPYPPLNVQDGIFGKLHITKTPTILIWDNAKNKAMCFLDYKEVINSTGEISEKTKFSIKKYIQ